MNFSQRDRVTKRLRKRNVRQRPSERVFKWKDSISSLSHASLKEADCPKWSRGSQYKRPISPLAGLIRFIPIEFRRKRPCPQNEDSIERRKKADDRRPITSSFVFCPRYDDTSAANRSADPPLRNLSNRSRAILTFKIAASMVLTDHFLPLIGDTAMSACSAAESPCDPKSNPIALNGGHG